MLKGGKAGWGNGEKSNDGPGDTYMLQVRGTSPLNTKAVQVDLTAESLNSNDVFVIFSKKAVYIWSGKVRFDLSFSLRKLYIFGQAR